MDLSLGPLIRASQKQRVEGFLAQDKADGIATVARGVVVDQAPASGFYQAPVLLRDVPVDHRVAQEEVFGPVLSAMCFEGEDQAASVANATVQPALTSPTTKSFGSRASVINTSLNDE